MADEEQQGAEESKMMTQEPTSAATPEDDRGATRSQAVKTPEDSNTNSTPTQEPKPETTQAKDNTDSKPQSATVSPKKTDDSQSGGGSSKPSTPRVEPAAEKKKEKEEEKEEEKDEKKEEQQKKDEGEEKKKEPKKEEPRFQPQPPKSEPKKTQEARSTRQEQKNETPRRSDTRGGRRAVARSEPQPEPEREKTDVSESRPQRPKVEYVKEELKRLQGNLKREATKVVPPKRREYKPFIFNTLEPYYNTHTTSFLVDKPAEAEHQVVGFTFSSRSTSLGLIDPWIDLRMDQEVLPQISARPITRSDIKSRGKGKSKKGGEPSRKEGSTRLPKFPVVAIETKDLVSKQLYYSDVPSLRKELKTKYTAQARSRRDTDYRRTQQDFYRMDLDRLDQVPEGNRQHMTSTYMAYLNTPGSRRALNDCVRTLNA